MQNPYSNDDYDLGVKKALYDSINIKPTYTALSLDYDKKRWSDNYLADDTKFTNDWYVKWYDDALKNTSTVYTKMRDLNTITLALDTTDHVASVVDWYPVTNPSYTHFRQNCSAEIKLLLENDLGGGGVGASTFIELASRAAGLNGVEAFVSRLRNARATNDDAAVLGGVDGVDIKKGHVYDPWFRDISEVGPSRYTVLKTDRVMASAHSDRTVELMFWLLETTIDGTKVKLLIYDEFSMGFFNKVKVNKHLERIGPHMVFTEDSIDLV